MEDTVKALRIQINTEYELSPNCSASQDGLRPTAATWNTACGFVEVVGASVQRSANGLYHKKQERSVCGETYYLRTMLWRSSLLRIYACKSSFIFSVVMNLLSSRR